MFYLVQILRQKRVTLTCNVSKRIYYPKHESLIAPPCV